MGGGGGVVGSNEEKSLTLHKSSIADSRAWGSPSCSCWPFMKASLKRFASGKLYRVLVCRDTDGGGKEVGGIEGKTYFRYSQIGSQASGVPQQDSH